jgi:hypothetical protein
MGEKMEKKYYFLAGFHRTGNTVLSSILNQNPDVYSTPLSPSPEYLWVLSNAFSNSENSIRITDNTGSLNLLSNILPSMYSHIDKPVIIERDKNWATPANFLNLKKYINPNPKIIFTVRPILEIITSYIIIEGDKIRNDMHSSGWWYKGYLSETDNMCEYLMRPKGSLDSSLTSISTLCNPENKNNIHIVEYDDLVEKPKEVMKNIYSFLELEPFIHNFNNIEKKEIDNDVLLGFSKDLHKVRKKLSKQSLKPEEVLSPYIINKYSGMEFWRNK